MQCHIGLYPSMLSRSVTVALRTSWDWLPWSDVVPLMRIRKTMTLLCDLALEPTETSDHLSPWHHNCCKITAQCSSATNRQNVKYRIVTQTSLEDTFYISNSKILILSLVRVNYNNNISISILLFLNSYFLMETSYFVM